MRTRIYTVGFNSKSLVKQVSNTDIVFTNNLSEAIVFVTKDEAEIFKNTNFNLIKSKFFQDLYVFATSKEI